MEIAILFLLSCFIRADGDLILMKHLSVITLCLVLCLAVLSCAATPRVILDLGKTPASVERATSLFESGKILRGCTYSPRCFPPGQNPLMPWNSGPARLGRFSPRLNTGFPWEVDMETRKRQNRFLTGWPSGTMSEKISPRVDGKDRVSIL